ncbi:MAG: HDOD domain-containing protein [Syntrophales bacterium]|jgi:HD-like signal output (HDOD) protein|nr:HDOD domain-containing protein [Syntrophales bacterium]
MPDNLEMQRMRARVEAINALPTVPSNLRQISIMLGKPRLTMDEISRFVANDPALAIKVLRMVNSAAYGFPGRISSVSHAIMLLGLNVIRGLLLGISVFELMQKNMSGLWEHSCACAVAARCIAQKKKMKEPEEVSICGLLHDIGKVIIMLQYPSEYEQTLSEAKGKDISLFEAEKESLAATHADVGLWLSQKWCFPINLVEAIGYHHRPQLSTRAPLETAIVHVSNSIVRAKGIGFAGDPFVSAIHPGAWQMLQLSDDDIRDVLTQIDESISIPGGEA